MQAHFPLPWRKRRQSLTDYLEGLTFETPEESDLFADVMKLKPKYRQVVHLFYYEDYSVREIASLPHISETAVSTRLSRARAKLKEALEEVWQDE